MADSWLGDQDEPASWEAAYAPALIAGDEVIATGETRYANGDVFSNLWQLEFAPDGRCARFVEWYGAAPEALDRVERLVAVASLWPMRMNGCSNVRWTIQATSTASGNATGTSPNDQSARRAQRRFSRFSAKLWVR